MIEKNYDTEKIGMLELQISRLQKQLGTAQDMNLELWNMYRKASKRAHVLEGILAEKEEQHDEL